jgi:hypothetical protein
MAGFGRGPGGKGKGKGKFGKGAKDAKKVGALFKRRKFCRFTAEKIEWIDYKDVDLLKEFINENGGSFRPALPAPRPAISGSSRMRSSARATWRCCPTPTFTEETWQCRSSFLRRW